jgi:hypothetical protein
MLGFSSDEIGWVGTLLIIALLGFVIVAASWRWRCNSVHRRGFDSKRTTNNATK